MRIGRNKIYFDKKGRYYWLKYFPSPIRMDGVKREYQEMLKKSDDRYNKDTLKYRKTLSENGFNYGNVYIKESF